MKLLAAILSLLVAQATAKYNPAVSKTDLLNFGNDACVMDAGESCSITDFQTGGKSTVVSPGGETRCIFSYSSDYKFQVWPGSSEKLLIYFQGGGACWDHATTVVPLCTTSCSSQPNTGLFDKSNENNPWRDYTIVHIMYCSGDAHAGIATRDYNDLRGEPVVQVGAKNVQTTLDWITAQTDFFPATGLTDLVISGASAGSIGAQVWADQILTQFKTTLPYQRAAVIPDSYAGVFPDGSQGPTMIDFGICDSPVIANTLDLQDKCDAGELTLQDMASAAMGRHEDVPFAYIQSKRDIVQEAYYDVIGLTMDREVDVVNDAVFFEGVNDVFSQYAKDHGNALTYMVDSPMHTYTGLPIVFSATANGLFGGGDEIKMVDWIGQFPLDVNQTADSICNGDIIPLADRPKHYTNYCAEETVASYTQK
jgi:hypothetical protein